MNNYLTLALTLLFGVSFTASNAQETRFFMPSEIRKAYEKGTRAYDGQPGENYWQNSADYKIDVTIDPEEKSIEGIEEVVYFNNSPDDIDQLVIRLYKDAYKKGNPRAYNLDERDIDGGVELSDLFINDVEYDFNDRKKIQRRGTNITINLQELLKPGSQLALRISWKQTIPAYSWVRTGAYDGTTSFVAYWYPQVSVYDDIFGWDKLNNTLMTEYYNNLANFDVNITIPENFIVWATGTLLNAEDILPAEMYDKFQQAHSSNKVVHIVSPDDIENGIRLLDSVWNYSASEVSDFAFAYSDRYEWEAAMQSVDGKMVFISSVHPADSTRDFSSHVGIQQKAMKHFSEDIPGIPYPYEAFTTFISNEGGGMEYPMMANNGGPGRGVTIHELFHTYFPMYVRTNERIWAWMDEGWAVYNTEVVTNRFFKDDYEFSTLFSGMSRGGASGTNADLPLFTSSEFLSGKNYGYASYGTGSFVYTILHHHLGDELFFKCYREYIRRWANKAPSPYDFFYTFENVSGQDLGWLWKPWFYEFGVPDLAIESFNEGILTLVKKGSKPVPIILVVNYADGKSEILDRSAGIWADGIERVEIAIPKYRDVVKLSLNEMVSDENPVDNFFPPILSLYENLNISEEIFGHFETEGGFRIIVTKEDGLIYLNIPRGGMTMILLPEGNNIFKSIDGSMEVEFILNDSGTCTGMDMDWYRFMHAEKQD